MSFSDLYVKLFNTLYLLTAFYRFIQHKRPNFSVKDNNLKNNSMIADVSTIICSTFLLTNNGTVLYPNNPAPYCTNCPVCNKMLCPGYISSILFNFIVPIPVP